MNRYLMETNYKNYGEWIFSSVEEELSHPYFAISGSCDTGAEVLNEGDIGIGESIGCVGDGFLSLANLTFYDGRLAEKSDEIVMNLTTLAKMGYSMELGQTISIKVQKEDAMFEQDFTLVGIIRDFSTTWKYIDGKPLPSCLITKEALAQMGGKLFTTYFYQLDRIYEKIPVQEMKDALIEPGQIVFNSYVYENTVWGSEEMFQDMQDILILIAALVLSYLMMSYVAKRRKWYYQFRCTGVGKIQICSMIFIEGLYGTCPWAVVGFVLPYLMAMPLCTMVSQKQQLPSIFVIDTVGLLKQIGTVAGVILLVLLIACLGISDRRLSNNVNEVTQGQLRRLKRAAKKSKNTAKHFLKRQDMKHPLQKIAMIMCTIAVSTILITCIHVILWKYEEYQLITERKSDFYAVKRFKENISYTYLVEDVFGNVKEEERESVIGATFSQIDVGMDEQMEKELRAIEGIKQIEMQIYDWDAKLDWDGKEDSQVYLFVRKLWERDNFVNEEELQCYIEDRINYHFHIDTYEDLKNTYPAVFESAKIEKEAFLRGEQIIVTIPNYETNYMDEQGVITDGYHIQETTLKDGMTVIWKSKRMDMTIPVTVNALTLTEEQLNELYISSSEYHVFATMGFAERIAKANGTQARYNNLEIDFEPNTSFVSTTKRLAALLQENDFYYQVDWETKQMAWEEFMNSVCIYGTLFCMILAVYLVLQMNVNQMKNFNRARQYHLLKRLGMSDSFLIRMIVKQGIKDIVWLYVGVAFGYVMYGVVEHMEWTSKYGADGMIISSFTGELVEGTFWRVLERLYENVNFMHFAVTMGFAVALMLAVSIISAKSAKASMLQYEKS